MHGRDARTLDATGGGEHPLPIEPLEPAIDTLDPKLRWLALLVVVLVVGGLAASGVVDLNPVAIRNFLDSLGPWGGIVFVLGFTLLQGTALVSVYLWLLLAAALWPPPVAIALSWLGAMGSSLLTFTVSRQLGRDAVLSRLPAWLRRVDDQLSERGFVAVLAMRGLTHVMFPMQLIYGVSGVRFAPFLAGTALGILPAICLVTLLGNQLTQWMVPALAAAP